MIENFIGYTFKKKNLLKQALTHPSFSQSEFQMFEFLGDRILGFVISDILFKTSKDIKSIANEFSNLVNTLALVKVANVWKISMFLKHDIEKLSNKVLADTVESIIAAIYLDSNFETIYNIIKNLYKNILKPLQEKKEPKMLLQEISQAHLLGLPEYKVLREEGMDHKKIYTIEVRVEKFGSAIGVGISKQEASKIAAQNLIQKINEKN
ncbi:ribonuclease III family protein [Alphaproteobacteria bacterium endosymbiont of Tiliacea citrago]|uniref:ribonuclease III family protein n=1 Tax=Alphaproteobacteria bacterium endosymbiont of Tiliacea citrago TaxID=3077944 RepID=UPI00313EF9EC